MEMLVNPFIKKVIQTNRLQQKEAISKAGPNGNWNKTVFGECGPLTI